MVFGRRIKGDEMYQNKKGQALVEFVIILPIFIFMIFGVIDLGKILYTKNNLESKMEEVITSYEKSKNEVEVERNLDLEKEHIVLSIAKEKEYTEFKLEKQMDIITPGLNSILGNPYQITTKRVIYSE